MIQCVWRAASFYMLGASYNYLHDAHTRVDLFYMRAKPRTKAFIDVICAIFLFFPLMIIMFKLAVDWAVKAWKINEVMFNSFWYPPAAPLSHDIRNWTLSANPAGVCQVCP